MASEISIKGMVCERCVSVIRQGIENMGYEVSKISLGKVSINDELSKDALGHISSFLRENGFAVISNRQVRVVTQVKEFIQEVFGDKMKYDARLKFSSLLSEKLLMNYDSISEMFTAMEGITLEKYIIGKRLEKVKELLVYSDLTLTEIAHITGFSSINHLSRQFKELTGLSPSHFKSIKTEKKKLTGNQSEV